MTIPRHDDQSPAPLSFSQERVWLFDQLGVGQFAYNESMAFSIEGALDRDALRCALDAVVARHAALRTTFHSGDDGPFQLSQPPRALDWQQIELQDVPAAERGLILEQRLGEETRRPFDLTRDLLVRPTLVVLGPEEHVFLVTQHHIAADAWSFGILKRELSAFYAAAVSGQSVELPELPFQYADYARWQRQNLDEQRLQLQLGYWQRQLKDLPTTLDVPADYSRPVLPTHRGGVNSLLLSARLVESLREISPGVTASLFTTLLAAFQVLLHRLSGQTDIAVGTSLMNRTPSETERLIGFFLDLVVLRGDLSGDPSFREFLLQVRRVAWGAYTHNDVPFQRLVEELRTKRDPSRNPLFQFGFVSRGAPRHSLNLPGLVVRPIELDPGLSKFDVTIYLDDVGESRDGAQRGDVRLSAEYSVDLFSCESIQRLLGHFRALLEGIALNPDAHISALPLDSSCPSPERSDTATVLVEPTVRGHRLDEVFEEQVERMPAAMAVKSGGRRFSYRTLSRQANRLARHLRALGVGPGTRVGLCLERSPDYLVGILAIFKAGGIYLPLDPDASAERLAAILLDAVPPLVVTDDRLRSRFFEAGPPCVCLDRDRNVLARYSSAVLPAVERGMDEATLLYTAGSPADPIGVIGRHRDVLHGITALNESRSVGPDDVCAIVGPVSAELLLPSLFGPLLRGTTVAIVDRETSRETRRLVTSLAANRVTHISLSPEVLGDLLEAVPTLGDRLPRLGHWQCDNGPLSPELIARFRSALPGRTLISCYGGAEASGAATWFTASNWDARRNWVPVGRSAGKARIHVLDVQGNPVPTGVRGAIYVGGDAVAAGYLNRPELTKERFIPDPFAAQPGAFLFRTGDVGRILSDGNVELHVRSADRLVADEPTAHGADRPDSDQPASEPTDRRIGRAAPLRDWIELQLSNLWMSLLGVERIGLEDDFFDLGGHSLLAVRLFEQVEHMFGKRLPLEVLFKAPTIKGLAEVLRQSGPIATSCVVPIQPIGSHSPLFFVHGLGGATIAYRRLAIALGTDQPFYGIQAPEPKGKGSRPDTIQERAAMYLAGIRQVQPEGPYYLGGYSGGGVWAFEMAQQLRAVGEEIAVVLFLDVAFPGAGAPRRIALERIRRDLDALEGLSAAERETYERWALKRAMEVARGPYGGRNEPGAPDGSIMPTYRRIQREHVRAIRGYRPRPYGGRVIHVRAGNPARFGQPGDSYAGWKNLIGDGLEVTGVPGEHLNLLREPQVNVVADLMREQLERARRDVANAEAVSRGSSPIEALRFESAMALAAT